jgi:hypothetical protein
VWLLVLGYAAVVATVAWYVGRSRGRELCLNYLVVVLWGATVMSFVDHLYSYYLRGEEFMEVSLDSLVLGFSLLLVALTVWLVTLLIKDPERVFAKRVG